MLHYICARFCFWRHQRNTALEAEARDRKDRWWSRYRRFSFGRRPIIDREE